MVIQCIQTVQSLAVDNLRHIPLRYRMYFDMPEWVEYRNGTLEKIQVESQLSSCMQLMSGMLQATQLDSSDCLYLIT